jgi:hypothetical protein
MELSSDRGTRLLPGLARPCAAQAAAGLHCWNLMQRWKTKCVLKQGLHFKLALLSASVRERKLASFSCMEPHSCVVARGVQRAGAAGLPRGCVSAGYTQSASATLDLASWRRPPRTSAVEIPIHFAESDFYSTALSLPRNSAAPRAGSALRCVSTCWASLLGFNAKMAKGTAFEPRGACVADARGRRGEYQCAQCCYRVVGSGVATRSAGMVAPSESPLEA